MALIAVIAVLSSAQALSGAFAQTVTPEPTATLVPEPTATLVPEPTSTPTPEPTPEPTATPSPEPTPTPTPEPTATPSPTPEPTPPPTPQPTATATPEPTATLVPEPTSTPTPEPEAPGVSAQSIVSGSGCLQTSSSDVAEVGEYVQFDCPQFSGDALVSYRRTFSAPSAGWQYALGSPASFTGAATTSSAILGSAPAVTLFLQPTDAVSAGGSGSMTITTQSCTLDGGSCLVGWQTVDTTTIGATRGCLTVMPSASAQAIDFGTVVWDGSGYPTVQRDLTITILGPAGCSTMGNNWAIELGTPGMTGPGSASIPPDAISYAGASGAVPTGLTPGSGGQALSGAGTRIATGSSSVRNGSSWTITLALAPPNNVPPGTYTTTLVVSAVSAGP